ncbi:host attachment protein [Aeromicrobium sp.]|uniref:host attachment protein n=1 Tax=Aeromicrobium sp. TaxID=1871063 RepID=UPI002FC9CEC1
MNTGWVLVADSAQARILEYDKHKLEPFKEFVHPESREHGQDLIGNRPNQNQHSMEKTRKGEEHQGLRDEESRKFAKQLSDYLSTAHAQNKFRKIVLVADPRFLGMLRQELSNPVAGCVASSIDKNVVRMNAKELATLVAKG